MLSALGAGSKVCTLLFLVECYIFNFKQTLELAHKLLLKNVVDPFWAIGKLGRLISGQPWMQLASRDVMFWCHVITSKQENSQHQIVGFLQFYPLIEI